MPTDRNRQRMLKRVQATWIAGVLEQSLHGAALMVLGLEEKADVLDNPWRLLMQEVDRPMRRCRRERVSSRSITRRKAGCSSGQAWRRENDTAA